jgi:hypothetical protein
VGNSRSDVPQPHTLITSDLMRRAAAGLATSDPELAGELAVRALRMDRQQADRDRARPLSITEGVPAEWRLSDLLLRSSAFLDAFSWGTNVATELRLRARLIRGVANVQPQRQDVRLFLAAIGEIGEHVGEHVET